MAQRRIGPVRGAGVAIVELEGDKPITPGALGWAAYAGILEKGQVGEMIICQSKEQFKKKCGGYFDESLLPDGCFDYFDLASGAGGLLLIRVTDGDEVQAEATLYSRKLVQTPMGTLKAKNGGRWGGKAKKMTGDVPTDIATDLTNTTIDTGVAMKVDEWKGGVVELADVANTQYPIISNDAAGVVTVAADSTMLDDYTAASGTTDQFYLTLENEGKALSYEIRDGEENPTTEFGLFVYVDGDLANKWPNLNVDPASSRYWENVINNDDNNDEVEAVDLWTGAPAAAVRPANHYGEIDTVTETVLTAVIGTIVINSPSAAGDPTFALGATTDEMDVQDVITCTFTTPLLFDVVSAKWGALGTGETLGVEVVSVNKWTPPFTLTAGGTPLEATDTVVITYRPFEVDSLIGGYVYPDKVNESREKYRIVDNAHDTITVAAGSDMTASGAPADEFLVVAPLEMEDGDDGIASLAEADYTQQAFDTGSSPFNQIFGKNLGLVKFACPGISEIHGSSFATTVAKEGIAYADAKNHQYREEIPSATVTEESADVYATETVGRNDFAVVSFPSYAYVADPEGNGEGKLKLTQSTGMIHGREASISRDYDGYHKAGAGVDATLPSILKLPTGDVVLNEEYLNPIGIGLIKKKLGNFILWGDRTLAIDPNWRWKHQREQMCYYENVLAESFDWIVFMLNEPRTEKLVVTALKDFFLPEWRKGAIQGDTFEDAVIIKCDSELNTPAVRAAGDMKCQVSLALVGVVERLVIEISKQGIFESVAA